MRNGKYDGTVEVYENDLIELLQQTKEKIPGIKLVVCQPFIVTGTSAVDKSWLEPFKKYQDAARRIADKFDSVWVPFQEVFDKAVEVAEPTYWTADGVHPSMAGCQLMAEAWLQAIK
jgi:lysophospholipase L1-like esterase